MHLVNFTCIAAVFILTFCFVNADDDQDFYQQMRLKAKDCVPGTVIEDDKMCPGACKCVMTGVIKCDPALCSNIQQNSIEDNPVSNPVDEPEPGPEPEEPTLGPVDDPESEPTEPSVAQLNDVSSVYKQLRADATGCKPGQEVSTDQCAGCTCILFGVMRCTDIKCLLPMGQQSGE